MRCGISTVPALLGDDDGFAVGGNDTWGCGKLRVVAGSCGVVAVACTADRWSRLPRRATRRFRVRKTASQSSSLSFLSYPEDSELWEDAANAFLHGWLGPGWLLSWVICSSLRDLSVELWFSYHLPPAGDLVYQAEDVNM